MKMQWVVELVTVLIIGTMGSNVQAAVLDFDDAVPKEPGRNQSGRIPNGYGGFDWDNFWAWDSISENTHFIWCLVSEPCFAFNGYGHPASLRASDGSRFDFVGSYLARMYTNIQDVTFTGYRDGSPVYSMVVSVGTVESSWFQFDFTNIDELSLASNGTQLSMDNTVLNIIPEPATLSLLALGGLVALRRRYC